MAARGARRAGLAAGLLLLALPVPLAARTILEPTAEPGADLRLVVRNAGDEAARAVVPRLVYQHVASAGDAATIPPGATHEWHLRLPPAPGAGTFPATVHVEYVDAAGRADSVPLVVVLPGPRPGPVRAALALGPLAGVADGRLTLDSSAERPVAGRVVFVLPGGVSTEPESLPAEVAPGGRTIVPVALQARGDVPPGTRRVYAWYEYTSDGGEHHTALATGELEVRAETSRRTRPLLVGAGALALTLGLLAIAWRRAARRGGRAASAG